MTLANDPSHLTIRDALPSDETEMLRLNAESVAMLSPLDGAAVRALLADCDLARVVEADDGIAAFVIALREGRAYASANYRWFEARHAAFLYVDRVVVDARHRGRGLAARLYADVFARAAALRVPHVACEYDIEPPNPASAAFHAAQGFREVGRQRLAGGKQVSMQMAHVRIAHSDGAAGPAAEGPP